MSNSSEPIASPAASSDMAGVVFNVDKRKSKRVRFCATVPIHSDVDRVPAGASFEAVESRDLSQGGISFYSETAPREPEILVQLGDGRDAMYVVARIVRCERDYADPQRRFIIGCQFERQVRAARR